jgi:hypothetical protein
MGPKREARRELGAGAPEVSPFERLAEIKALVDQTGGNGL